MCIAIYIYIYIYIERERYIYIAIYIYIYRGVGGRRPAADPWAEVNAAQARPIYLSIYLSIYRIYGFAEREREIDRCPKNFRICMICSERRPGSAYISLLFIYIISILYMFYYLCYYHIIYVV